MTVEIKRKQTIKMEMAHFTGPDEAILEGVYCTALLKGVSAKTAPPQNFQKL